MTCIAAVKNEDKSIWIVGDRRTIVGTTIYESSTKFWFSTSVVIGFSGSTVAKTVLDASPEFQELLDARVWITKQSSSNVYDRLMPTILKEIQQRFSSSMKDVSTNVHSSFSATLLVVAGGRFWQVILPLCSCVELSQQFAAIGDGERYVVGSLSTSSSKSSSSKLDLERLYIAMDIAADNCATVGKKLDTYFMSNEGIVVVTSDDTLADELQTKASP